MNIAFKLAKFWKVARLHPSRMIHESFNDHLHYSWCRYWGRGSRHMSDDPRSRRMAVRAFSSDSWRVSFVPERNAMMCMRTVPCYFLGYGACYMSLHRMEETSYTCRLATCIRKNAVLFPFRLVQKKKKNIVYPFVIDLLMWIGDDATNDGMAFTRASREPNGCILSTSSGPVIPSNVMCLNENVPMLIRIETL